MGWKWDVGEKGVGWGEERPGGELKVEEKMGERRKGHEKKGKRVCKNRIKGWVENKRSGEEKEMVKREREGGS